MVPDAGQLFRRSQPPDPLMPGRLVPRSWQYDPTIHAPAAYKRACPYDAFVPDELSTFAVHLDAPLAGLVSEAEHAILQLN